MTGNLSKRNLPFNRTIVELKPVAVMPNEERVYAFNRTIVELKPAWGIGTTSPAYLLIVP